MSRRMRVVTSVAPLVSRVGSTVSGVDELVANAPDGEQKARFAAVGLDSAAKTLDQRVDASKGDERVAMPDFREQRVAAEDDTRVRHEQVQQTKLLIGQVHIAALDAHAPPIEIDFDPQRMDGGECGWQSPGFQ
jgi:hypothetical protein